MHLLETPDMGVCTLHFGVQSRVWTWYLKSSLGVPTLRNKSPDLESGLEVCGVKTFECGHVVWTLESKTWSLDFRTDFSSTK